MCKGYFPIVFVLLFATIPLVSLQAEGVVAGAVYRISTCYTGNRELTVSNSSSAEDESVVLWKGTDVNAQRWKIVDAGNGEFLLENVFTGKKLFAKSNHAIVQNGQQITPAHKWEFVKVPDYPNCYYITNVGRTGCLEVVPETTSDEDGKALRIFSLNGSYDARQAWRMERVDEIPNQVTPQMRTAMMAAWKSRYFDWLKTSRGFWGEAECMEILLDAFETTGKEEYKIMFEEVYKHFVSYPAGWGKPGNGKDWMWNEFNDDVAWAVLASVRAYLMFGTHPTSGIDYLNIAKTNFDKMYKRALYHVDNLYYLLRWKQGNPGTTSCVNGPSQVAACYLAKATGDDGYYQKAKMLYENQRIYLYEPATGRVYDSFDNNWASAYNQGTYLGAALMLYEKYGDAIYKKDAEKILDFTMKNLCDSEGILTSVDSESGDYVNFKAILLRYVRRYVTELSKEDAGEWLRKNALRAYNNRNSRGLSRIEWKTKTDESDNWSGIGCMASVAIVMNAPLNTKSIRKNAFSTIRAGDFDYISKAYSVNIQNNGDLELSAVENGAYLGYNAVDCRQDFATGIELQVMNDGHLRSVEVRTGSPTGDLHTTVTIPPSDNTWRHIRADFNPKILGKHNLYLVFKGNKNGLKFKSFRLIRGETDYAQVQSKDITDDGGILTSQYEDSNASEDLGKLVDNDPKTKYSISNQTDLWVSYQAAMRYTLTSYSICSADHDASKDPRSWILYGSSNGLNWDVIDVQKNRVFGKRKATLNFPLTSVNPYRFFKLHIDDNNGGEGIHLAEWQLFGDEFVEDLNYDLIEAGNLFVSNMTQDEIRKLSDNNHNTACNFKVVSDSTISIVFKSPIPLQLQGYALVSSKEPAGSDPRSWNLMASKDSISWTQIDRRTNQVFKSRGLRKNFDRQNTTEYKYFRLDIVSAKNINADFISLSEWELFGHFIDKYDVSSNLDGVLKAQWEGKYNESETIDERYFNLIDKKKTGKYFVGGRKGFWAIYQSKRSVQLHAYSLVSANDAVNRDPSKWTLYGSNDNLSWTVIDKRENQVFPYRYTTLYYVCNTNKKYQYFKLDVEENGGEKNVQLGEWQLFGSFNDYQTDLTENGGILTSLYPASYGTSLKNLIDNSDVSKYHLDITSGNFGSGIWFQYESRQAVKLTAYSLTSSNGIPDNDPHAWVLKASENQEDWVDLDVRDNVEFANRNQRKMFVLDNGHHVPYLFFKLYVTKRKSDASRGFQLAEWELFGSTVSETNNVSFSSLAVFPNPAENEILVGADFRGVVEIYNIEGMKVYSDVLDGAFIDISSLSKGMYFIQLKSEEKTKIKKIIKK